MSLQHMADRGDGAGERLALTGGHLDDVALQEPEGALQLDVERPQVDGAVGGFPDQGEELRAVRGLLGDVEFLGLRAERVVGEFGGPVGVGFGVLDHTQRLRLVASRLGAQKAPHAVAQLSHRNISPDRSRFRRDPPPPGGQVSNNGTRPLVDRGRRHYDQSTRFGSRTKDGP